MLGGRRAGKSTILSSILSQLKANTPGDICTVIDKTDYTGKPLTQLRVKQNEIADYISKKTEGPEFLVDMNKTEEMGTYTLEVTAGDNTVFLDFVDVPGEWMRAGFDEFELLKKKVQDSDVFVIAIDTPFLMGSDDDMGAAVNDVYNRVDEITQLMTNVLINNPEDKKFILLCPVKCERWVRNGEADKVVEMVKKAYKDLINRWVNKEEVTIQIMPIQTAGGIEFSRMLPAKLYFKDDEDATGASCSCDDKTGKLMKGDGTSIQLTAGSRVEDDLAWTIDHTTIPLSWYRKNGAGLKQKFCEQPGFHILNFLVEKEDGVRKKEAEFQRQQKNNDFVLKYLAEIFKPTFGQYLSEWKEAMKGLSPYLKTEGDGFCYVKSKIV